MTRIRTLQMSALGAAGLLATALPAFGQAAPPPPEAAPPPPAPAVEVAPVPTAMAPMAMAKAADDMTGSVGFGVGVATNAELIGTTANSVAIKYWMHDNLALVPALGFSVQKAMGTDSIWSLNPELVVLFVPFKSTSTRFLIGGGLGFSVGKTPPADTAFSINLPIQAGVEHFFTRWLSLGIAARNQLFTYQTQGDAWSMAFSIDTTQLLGNVFFYTD